MRRRDFRERMWVEFACLGCMEGNHNYSKGPVTGVGRLVTATDCRNTLFLCKGAGPMHRLYWNEVTKKIPWEEAALLELGT